MKVTDSVDAVWDNANLLTEEPQAAKSIVAMLWKASVSETHQMISIRYQFVMQCISKQWTFSSDISLSMVTYLNTCNVKQRNNLNCIDQYVCRSLRLWNSPDREEA